MFSAVQDEWVISTVEASQGQRTLKDYGPLHATMQWPVGMEAPITRGMPYVTVVYSGATPKLSTIYAILDINGNGASGTVTDTRFEVQVNSGDTWIIYTQELVTFSFEGSLITASAPLNSALRMAVAKDGGSTADLDAHSSAIVTGGTVEAVSSGDSATITFNWEVEGSGDALIMALPHHMDVLNNPSTVSLSYTTVKGDMTGVIGNQWSLSEDLTTIEFRTPRDPDSDRVDQIIAALNEDLSFEAQTLDPYFGGKELAVLARLAVIADHVGETALRDQYVQKTKDTLEMWLDATNTDPLLYDQTWGGIVATNGLSDPNADFGQGYYNDHHFHYGYHIYAAAVITLFDPSWANTYNDKVIDIVRDIAEPSGADPYFTAARSKDWYCGHSWASGIQAAFADSHNQESTSESVNGWYAVYLYGLASGNERLKDMGRLLLATEIRSAHKYWQIRNEDTVYPAPFSDNKVVGILWSTKVDYATWFGANVEFIHCIQMLPFTPISEELLRESWIQEEYNILVQAFNSADEGWRGYIIMAHGIIDTNAAWAEAEALTSFDDGNTKSNTYYWLATHP